MAFCSNCGTQYADGGRFCPKCGAPAAAQPMAPPVYAPPPQPPPYGAYAPPPQAPYPNYAPPPQPMYANMQAQPRYGGKSKSTAVILAILFSFFTWLYTFKRDGMKFWACLILYGISLVTIVSGIYLYDIQLLIFPAIWLWAVIMALARSGNWYAQY